MNNWGFSLPDNKEITYDTANREVYQGILAEVPSMARCMACGQCAAACTRDITSFAGMRSLILCLHRGELSQASQLATECQLCGMCSLVCPRAVNLRKLCLEIKKHFNKQAHGI